MREQNLTLDHRQAAAFDLVASGAVADLVLHGVTAGVSVGDLLTLRDLEGVTLGSLTVASVSDSVVSGAVEVRQRLDRPDYPGLWLSTDEARAEIARRGWRPSVRAIVAGPVVSAAALDEAVAAGPLLVLVLTEGAADDAAHHARVRGWVQRSAAYGNRVLLVLVPAPDNLPDSVRSSIASAFGASSVLSELEPDPSYAAGVGRGGVTLLFTGLSGSGKSTIASRVLVRLLASGVTTSMLDGDVVRTHLSKGLGFSREDRDTNVRRIGWVAAEVTKHGGFAVAAPIAPYDATRKAVRAMVEQFGTFVLVHVATPLEVCEARDRKGLYAKARAGEIPEFTGISDPYEEPADADLVIDTQAESAEDAADRVMAYLRDRGLLPS